VSAPIDTLKAPDPLLAAIQNAESFDKRAFVMWLSMQRRAVQKAAQQCPPWKIWELKGKPCFVHGYARDGHLIVRGIGDQMQTNVHVYPDEVKDVTNDVRRQCGLPAI
jgi:hypothetical protein